MCYRVLLFFCSGENRECVKADRHGATFFQSWRATLAVQPLHVMVRHRVACNSCAAKLLRVCPPLQATSAKDAQHGGRGIPPRKVPPMDNSTYGQFHQWTIPPMEITIFFV